jgi:hypothetical protein
MTFNTKITFGIIVLNGEPFTRYCLRSLYPFAHQIIVVEGAATAAAAIADENGHSTDGTLETLWRFKEEEDPKNKLIIVTAENEGYPNGFWPGEKDEQSQAYAKRATGDYLWQVDIDEFYKPEDMQFILKMLQNNPEITAVSFKQITFWGGLNYIVDGWYLKQDWCAKGIHRIFLWGPSYRYVTHRPPTACNPQGRDLRTLKWIDGHQLAQQGIFLYHYSLVFPKQVIDKCTYYSQAGWASHAKDAMKWMYNNYLRLKNPFRVHNVYQYPSWLERFQGQHPLEVLRLQQDISEGRINVSVELRPIDDIEQLLQSRTYILKRAALKILTPLGKQAFRMRNLGGQVKRKVQHVIEKI